jgi:citrate lyase subunit beta/citryl-CoA lyase
VSKRSRESPRRSNLTLPGSNERFLAKAPSIDADAFILDLEDAVAPGEKVGARAKICAAVLENDFGGRPVTVRINGWTTEWARDDVATVVAGCKGRLDAVMVPKASGPEEIRAVSALIDEIERIEGITLGTTGIDILVESAVGLASVEATVLASPRIESLSVGLGDLAATLGMPVLVAGEPVAGYPGDIYHYALFRLLVAGRAAEIAVIDGAYQRVEDLETLEQIARRTRALGFDGKWAIHPSQVGVLNGIYAPSPEEIARAQAVISALDAAIESDQAGAIRDADEMIDEASRTMAIAVLARAARSMPIQGRP